jgi:hypothetical protein
MLTINQIKAKLNEIQASHDQLNDFYFGDFSDFGTERKFTYNVLAADLLPGTLSKGVLSSKFTLVIIGRVNEDNSNRINVLSDTQTQILGVFSQLAEYFSINNIELAREAVLSDVNEGFNDDNVVGHQLEITINQFFSRSDCEVPSSFNPTVRPGDTTIYDQDGNVVTTLNYGQSYTVTLFDTINGGAPDTVYEITITPSLT